MHGKTCIITIEKSGAILLTLYPNRAVDNQMYVAACSPARDLSADYHAWGHSSVVDPK